MRRLAMLAASVLILAAAAAAQPAGRLPELPATLRLTPDSAACLAATRSTQVAIDEQQVISAQGALREAQSLNDVQVEGQASYTRSGPPSTIELPGGDGAEIEVSPSSTHRETIQVTWPLYIGRRLQHATDAARAGITAAEENVQAREIQAAFTARQTAYAVLRLEQLVAVAEQRVTAVAEHLRITQAMFEAGTAPRFEVVQAETELAQPRGDIIRARTAVAQQKAALAQLIVVPQTTEIIVEEGPPPALPEGDLRSLIDTAVAERSEIAALQAAVRSREASVRLAQASNDPSVAVVGQVNNQSESFAASGVTWSITAAVTVPIFTGGAKEAQVTQARAALETARLNVELASEQVGLQVSQALLNVQDAREALAVAEQGEVEAREQVRIAQVRFASGVGLGVEVLDAQTALAAAQTQVVNARYDLQVATATLRAALGLPDFTKEPS